MSCDLYPIRVYFDGYAGCVKTIGVYRKITTPPRIVGLPVLAAIDYAPSVVQDLTPLGGPRREMYPDEIEAVRAFLILVLGGMA
jgi:hypothetical protein